MTTDEIPINVINGQNDSNYQLITYEKSMSMTASDQDCQSSVNSHMS